MTAWIGRPIGPSLVQTAVRVVLKVVLGLAISVTLVPLAFGHAAARGNDPCPEPNDALGAACSLVAGVDVLGFVSRSDDVDAYRVDVLDFDAAVLVQLADSPAYSLRLTDGNGAVIARSAGTGSINVTVRSPGSYYVLVDSQTGEFSDANAYRLVHRLSYPSATAPQVIYTSRNRPDAFRLYTGSTDYADFSEVGGVYTITLKVDGAIVEPARAVSYFGPDVTDFTLTVDARITNDVEGGYQIYFRRADENNLHQVTFDARDNSVLLLRRVSGVSNQIDRIAIGAASTGANRMVIRCEGDEFRVYVNGEELIRVADGAPQAGQIGLGAVAWDAPPSVAFDNLIVTTPSRG